MRKLLLSKRKAQQGMVTVEMAFAAIGIGLAMVVCAGIFSICLAQIRCVDAAAEIARQTARDDHAAVSQIEAGLPSSAQVEIGRQGDQVGVTVSIQVQPWGGRMPTFTVQSSAHVQHEGG